MKQPKRLLVLAPHTDDAELGCGGSICRLLEEGIDVQIAVFSTAELSLPPNTPKDTLKKEFLEATTILGLEKSALTIYDYPVRMLSYHRQEVLESLIVLKRDLEPDVVFVPSSSDLHQDHQVLFAEAARAFKQITLWGYELPWNHITFPAQGFVALQAAHIERKCQALRVYRSQVELGKPYFARSFIEGLARVRGMQLGTEFAEAFEVVRIRW
jgi:LmbE family N-acetylglucosaminyl deacetylase